MSSVADIIQLTKERRPPQGRSQEIFRQATQYFTGSGLVILSSVISYPLLTRLLTQRDYGMMTIISSSLFLAVSISKVGLQHAAVRFYPEHSAPEQNVAFRSTLFWIPILNAVALASVVLAVLSAVARRITSYPLRTILLAAALIVVLETAQAMLLNFMRAARQAARYTIVYTVIRYGQLGFCLATLVLVRRDLVGFYMGWLIWDVVEIAYLLYGAMFSEHTLSFAHYDSRILKMALHFGAPLLFMEIGNMLLTYADRYVIAGSMGTVETAIYSAAYNFTSSVQGLFVTSLSSFVFPWASEIWTKHSGKETEHFASKILDYFLVIAIPACVGVAVLRTPIMVIFASSKYASSASLLPPLIASQISFGVYVILSLGLYLNKRTAIMAWQMIIATGLNIFANLILIPRIGLMGAAWAMVAANGLLLLMVMKTSLPLLRVKPDWMLLFKVVVAAIIMAIVVHSIPFTGNLSRLLVGSFVGGGIYSLLIISMDQKLRWFISRQLRTVKP